MKILFVCLGNICRSPIGEGLMMKLSNQHDLNLIVDSAGTSAHHVGEQPDIRSINISKKFDIDIEKQTSRQFILSDFDRFDCIFVMDKSNFNNLMGLKKSNKLHILRDYDSIGQGQDVPDPYYGGADGFLQCFEMIESSCVNFLKQHKMIT